MQKQQIFDNALNKILSSDDLLSAIKLFPCAIGEITDCVLSDQNIDDRFYYSNRDEFMFYVANKLNMTI